MDISYQMAASICDRLMTGETVQSITARDDMPSRIRLAELVRDCPLFRDAVQLRRDVIRTVD
jgi:hypothetical protein